MNACICLFIILSYGARVYSLWPNVGTVLFTSQDLKRNVWTKADLALLQARKHFQGLIPPPETVALNKEYVDRILDYFKGVYACIRHESKGDPEMEQILTTAVSDTIGGYLRSFVLPVTRLYFYGGTVTYDDMTKMHVFFDEIKEYLSTEGEGWRDPARRVIDGIILNSGRLPRENIERENVCRRYKNPCNSFLYLENDGDVENEDEIAIPLPEINWEDNTIFMPLMNETTFSLCSPKHNNSLRKYYDNALCCAKNIGPSVEEKFNKKFQTWVTSDVAPHLSDDNVYAALGNVLSLLNRTRILCDVIIKAYDDKTLPAVPTIAEAAIPKKEHNQCGKSSILRLLASKKIAIVVGILALEIVWCMLACKQLFFKKKKCKDRCTFVDAIEKGEYKSERCKDKDKKSFFSTLFDKDHFGFRKTPSESTKRRQRDSIVNMNKHSNASAYSGFDATIAGAQLRNKPAANVKHSGVASTVPSRSRQSQTTVQQKSSHGVSTKKPRPVSNSAINTYQCEVPPAKIKSKTIKIPAPPLSTETEYELSPKVITKTGRRHRESRKSCETIISCDEFSDSLYNLPLQSMQSSSRADLYAVITRSQRDFETTVAGENVQLRQKKSAVQFEIISQTERRTSVIPPPPPPRQKTDSFPCKGNELVPINAIKEANEGIPPHGPPVEPKPYSTDTCDQSLLMRIDAQTETTLEKAKTFHLRKEFILSQNSSRRTHKKYIEIQIDRPENTEIKLGVTEIVSPKKSSQSPRKFLVSKIPKMAPKYEEPKPESFKEVTSCVEKSDTDESPDRRDPKVCGKYSRLPKRLPSTSADQGIRESKIPKLAVKEKSYGHGIFKFCRTRCRTKGESPRQRLLKRDQSPDVCQKINEDSEKSRESSPVVVRKRKLKLRLRKPKAADDTVVKADKKSTIRYSRLNKTL